MTIFLKWKNIKDMKNSIISKVQDIILKRYNEVPQIYFGINSDEKSRIKSQGYLEALWWMLQEIKKIESEEIK